MTGLSAAPLRIAVAGASGRMGRMLIEAVNAAGPMLQPSPARLDIGSDTAQPAWATRRC